MIAGSSPASQRRTDGGFTLVELMIVIAIIGILGTTVVSYMTTKSTPQDAATLITDTAREAGRRAIKVGTGTASMNTNEGKVRTRMRMQRIGASMFITIEELQADGTWPTTPTYKVEFPETFIAMDYFQLGAVLTDGANGIEPVGSVEGAGVVLECYTDGRCCSRLSIGSSRPSTCSGVTYYLRNLKAGNQPFARAIVLPLGGSTRVVKHW